MLINSVDFLMRDFFGSAAQKSKNFGHLFVGVCLGHVKRQFWAGEREKKKKTYRQKKVLKSPVRLSHQTYVAFNLLNVFIKKIWTFRKGLFRLCEETFGYQIAM